MPLFDKHEVIATILKTGLVPVFYYGDTSTVINVCETIVDAGSPIVEFTNRGPMAFKVFEEIIRWRNSKKENLIIGAGTILDSATASLYINIGADFIVAPNFNPEVAKLCNRRNVVYIPGCSTLTEITAAEAFGVDIFKIFPAEVLGPKFIKNILAPCPWLKLMPSGGIRPTRDEIKEWINAGAVALNIGSALLRRDLIMSGRFQELRKMVEECISYIREAREHKSQK